jgi:hypothetical protein
MRRVRDPDKLRERVVGWRDLDPHPERRHRRNQALKRRRKPSIDRFPLGRISRRVRPFLGLL